MAQVKAKTKTSGLKRAAAKGSPATLRGLPLAPNFLNRYLVPLAYIGGPVIIFAPIAVACDLHIILTLFFFIIASFWAMLMPAVFVFISVWVIYIFVVMLTPTTGSPAAHFGMVIMEPEEDMLLWARLGCMPAKNIPIAKSNPEVILLKFVLL